MQVRFEDLEKLLKLQSVDVDIIRVQKEIDDLPQRAQLDALKAKLGDLNEKREKVLAMQHRVEADTMRLSTEDEILANKQQHAQELIDNAGADYRSVESHSKEMSGFAKRRAELDGKLAALMEESQKIEAVLNQLDKAISIIERDAFQVDESYRGEVAALTASMDDMKQERAREAQAIPADLIDLYAQTARKTGGVAIGRLDDNRCGVCRSVIEGGRLIELRAKAPLGVCPACKRLLVIE